jgi:hypothetical protein
MSAAKANLGDLYVEDLPGQGCIFTLDLPRQQSRSARINNPSPTPEHGSSGAKQGMRPGHTCEPLSARIDTRHLGERCQPLI